MPTQNSTKQSLDVFSVQLKPLTIEDADLLYELSISVRWPHRYRDIVTVMGTGTGYLATDEIGRVLSSGMRFSVAKNLETIGMMITVPRLQARGAGRWILERLIRESTCESQLLYSTRKGFPLYQSEGFEKQRPVAQHQGIAHEAPLPEEARNFQVRAFEKADLAPLRKLDNAAFGADRRRLLSTLFARADKIVVLENGDNIDGYAVLRPFGRGQIMGPVVARSSSMAMALLAPLIKQATGSFLRIDVPTSSSELTEYLISSGLNLFDTVFEMRRGRALPLSPNVHVFGLAFQATG